MKTIVLAGYASCIQVVTIFFLVTLVNAQTEVVKVVPVDDEGKPIGKEITVEIPSFDLEKEKAIRQDGRKYLGERPVPAPDETKRFAEEALNAMPPAMRRKIEEEKMTTSGSALSDKDKEKWSLYSQYVEREVKKHAPREHYHESLRVTNSAGTEFLFMGLKFMMVSSVDCEGNQVSASQKEWIKQPDIFHEDGFEHLDEFMNRLTASEAKFTSIIANFWKKEAVIGVRKRGDEFTVGEIIDLPKEPEKEKMVRDFFAKRNMTPSHDYLAQNDTTRIIDYQFPADQELLIELSHSMLVEFYGATSDDAVEITYSEH